MYDDLPLTGKNFFVLINNKKSQFHCTLIMQWLFLRLVFVKDFIATEHSILFRDDESVIKCIRSEAFKNYVKMYGCFIFVIENLVVIYQMPAELKNKNTYEFT